ncbi:cysteine hydrolase family protein [Tsukamurella ocularis]|uniref:cysteine hydrolase family protein n=1 Tax=Tsukamurella ocularis TaxID=1970234 RepID=UPI00216A85C8|nr:isochorismatase family cysteine hydrolase [Tsukamurella ocularis]MCS3779897.1 nicotinamidase-related amidase [Tsukamurella ocularis]MCS3788703.1 nicotinamidase-related amidase [Tsukamurella ocularis]MCS3849913.1 nicotinamidase-related amidase [Tsukamurella ocularis]
MTASTPAADYTAPHWDRSALVLIDVQNDFVSGPSPIPGTAELVPAMARLAAAFRAAGRPVVHVVRLYVPGGSDVDPVRRSAVEAGGRIVAPGSAGSEVPAALLGVPLDHELLLSGAVQKVGDAEVVLFKPRWSAFHRTGLDGYLRGLGVDTVIVAGCNLPNCPRATLFDASERDYRAAVVADATSQATDQRLDDLRLIGVEVLTTASVVDALAGNPVAPDP